MYLIFSLIMMNIHAQTMTENAGWLFLTHEQKLSQKWKLSAELQLRSTDEFDYLKNVLLRPGLHYNFTKRQSATLGYTYFGTWEKENDEKSFEPEHRMWEQYKIDGKIKRAEIQNRFRLEQRFVEKEDDHAFSQRFRYQVRGDFPLSVNEDFTKGLFLGLQNEVFLNVQNKEKANDRFFDQNRLYAVLGYRFSKKVNAEVGYMYRYQIEEMNKLNSNILQFAIATEL